MKLTGKYLFKALLISPLLWVFPTLAAPEKVLSESLTFYVIPPPRKINWSSPQSLSRTTLVAAATSSYHSIGHITARVSCTTDKGEAVSYWAGMTSSDNNPSDISLLAKEKLALGILFYDFNGRLENENDIAPDVVKGRNLLNRLFTLRFLINGQHCERLKKYYEWYKSSKARQVYGLKHRPRYNEGAGCTAFAASFLEVAGLLDQKIKTAWSKQVLVPESLIGTRNNPVSLQRMLLSRKANSWASPSAPHRPLFFYDTQFIAEWSQALMSRGLDPRTINYDHAMYPLMHKKITVPKYSADARVPVTYVKVSNGYYGLVFDRRAWPAATDAIFKK